MATSTTKLNTLLADSTVLYQKLRHYHWNVRGPLFFALHEKFEEVYTEFADIIDEIAERIVALDVVPLHTLRHMLEASTLQEDAEVPEAGVMVGRTIADLEALQAALVDVIAEAEAADDRTTVNLLDGISDQLAGHIWMFKAWRDKA